MQLVRRLRWSTSIGWRCRGGMQTPLTVRTPCAAYDLAGVVIVRTRQEQRYGLMSNDAASCTLTCELGRICHTQAALHLGPLAADIAVFCAHGGAHGIFCFS